MSCSVSKDSLLAVTTELARQASGISGSTTYSRTKVLFQLLTDYSVRHPNKGLFQIKKSDIIEGHMLPGTPRQNCNYRHCLLHSWHSQSIIIIKRRTLKEEASCIDPKETNTIKIAVI